MNNMYVSMDGFYRNPETFKRAAQMISRSFIFINWEDYYFKEKILDIQPTKTFEKPSHVRKSKESYLERLDQRVVEWTKYKTDRKFYQKKDNVNYNQQYRKIVLKQPTVTLTLEDFRAARKWLLEMRIARIPSNNPTPFVEAVL